MITPIDWPHGISEIFLVITPPSPATSHTHGPSYFPAEHWARSIKPLHEFYSTQAVMHHLWEANFQKPFGLSAPLLLQLLSQKQRNCAYVKRCCTYAPLDSWLHLCLGGKKMQMRIVKYNHCLLEPAVHRKRALLTHSYTLGLLLLQ